MKSVLRSCLSHCLCTRIAQKYMVPGMNLMTKARSVSSLTPLTMRHHKSTWVHPVFNTICYSTMTIPVTSCENHLQLLQSIHSGDSSFLLLQRARSFFLCILATTRYVLLPFHTYRQTKNPIIESTLKDVFNNNVPFFEENTFNVLL